MPRCVVAVLFTVLTVANAINRPVYKIVLTQKGFAQFVRYDIDTPPLRQFTFCIWIRIYDINGDQTIFSYGNGSHRLVSVWLASGGLKMKIMIDGKYATSAPVEVLKDVWRHICLSYQSDFGAWALYVDSRLTLCESSRRLYGLILPSGGSMVVGYGMNDKGATNGIEGEIFGANMILVSTIERNFTLKQISGNRRFIQNKLRKDVQYPNDYIILSKLKNGKVRNTFEKPVSHFHPTTHKEKTISEIIHSAESLESSTRAMNRSRLKPHIPRKTTTTTDKNSINFWSLVHDNEDAIKVQPNTNVEQYSLKSHRKVSEHEMPPLPGSINLDYLNDRLVTRENTQPIDKRFRAATKPVSNQDLYECEKPPPLHKDNKVYGQWTSSKFAGNVLNYLKNSKFNTREFKKIPPTIPLHKISDAFPYASDFKPAKVRPLTQFRRRNFIDHQLVPNKRAARNPQINVQVLEEDLRNSILRTHSYVRPKTVEITNRGKRRKKMEHRRYRNAEASSQEASDSTEEEPSVEKTKVTTARAIQKPKNMVAILPFLKSLEYIIEDPDENGSDQILSSDVYTRSLSNRNKWHNVKSYVNDYAPRQIGNENIDDMIADANKRLPGLRLNYDHDGRKTTQGEKVRMAKEKKLAKAVSNHSQYGDDSISLLKYNHGFLPGHEAKLQNDKIKSKNRGRPKLKKNFDEHVKIGNALNEQDVIGNNYAEKKRNFEGGDENIPDINKYRSNLDGVYVNIPPSLPALRVCKNVDQSEGVLYIQSDQSIDLTHIMSPLKSKNMGIDFVQQNYKKCSLEDSNFENNPLLLIEWSKTPIRLFGGAEAKTTTDLCGFF